MKTEITVEDGCNMYSVKVDERNGAVVARGFGVMVDAYTVIHDDGDADLSEFVDNYVNWRIIEAACKLRRAWEDRQKLPKGWEKMATCGIGVGDDAIFAVVVFASSPDGILVRGHATPEQCAQIPAAMAYVRELESGGNDG